MNIDDLVRQSLEDHARTVTPPPADLDSYVRSGIRRERLRVAGLAALVATMVAAVSLPLWTKGDAAPEPATELQQLGVEGALWVDHEGIHIDDQVVEPSQPPGDILQIAPVHEGAVYVVADSTEQGDVSVWSIDESGEERRLSDRGPSGAHQLVTDPVGATAAWVEWDWGSMTSELVVVDADAGTELGREALPPAGWRNWQVVSTTADEVAVTDLGYGQTQVWRAGSDGLRALTPSGTAGGQLVVDSKAGAQITVELENRDLVYTIVDGNGRDVALPEHASGPMELSPDGRYAFFVARADRNFRDGGEPPPEPMTLLDLQTGDTTSLGPVTLNGGDINGADANGGPGWVDDDTFLVVQRNEADTEQRVWACEAPSATCAAATGWVAEDEPLVVPSVGIPL